jgi:hypothetical protein
MNWTVPARDLPNSIFCCVLSVASEQEVSGVDEWHLVNEVN